jgi:hypothetical protein
MIHYHGLPITPESVAVRAITGAHVFVTYRDRRQLPLAVSVAQSFALDNGAFIAWRSGEPVKDWSGFYAWVDECRRVPSFDFAVIPDVIDGDEAANDALLHRWPWRLSAPWLGAPVWHMHESLHRLDGLARDWPRVCIGSSGEFAAVGSSRWFGRMAEAMHTVCDERGRPLCKLHGLRMLDPAIYSRFPFASADSTNIARNVSIDTKWRGTYSPSTLDARALVLRDRTEAAQAPATWERDRAGIQSRLFDDLLDV